jgi:HAD superfamily hydrolase (TIGR01549 family)
LILIRWSTALCELKSILLFYRERRKIHHRGGDYAFAMDSKGRDVMLERTSRWMAPIVGRVGLRPGVREALEALKSKGVRQVVLSDHYSDAKLRALGVREFFDAVYSAEETGFLKPNPTPFLSVSKSEGISPKALLHIGDRRETDGEGAKSAGSQGLVLGEDFPSFRTLSLPPRTLD